MNASGLAYILKKAVTHVLHTFEIIREEGRCFTCHFTSRRVALGAKYFVTLVGSGTYNLLDWYQILKIGIAYQ